MNRRTLKDGTEVPELPEVVELKVKTKCPDKWLLIDRETGEAYTACIVQGQTQWKKVYNAEWTVDA